MNNDAIARIAHEINRAYCQSLGDDSQPPWEDAPDWQKQSALAGVAMHLANPDATPEQSHESWLAQKEADGWVYGEVKDPEKKEHPCCVPYDQLPPEQKAKDYLFRATVHLMKAVPEVPPVLAEQAAEAAQQSPKAFPPKNPSLSSLPDVVPVQYIGIKPEYKDRLYKTSLHFLPGQIRNLPKETAALFLRHRDMFAVAKEAAPEPKKKQVAKDDTQAVLDESAKRREEEEDTHANKQDLIDRINLMDKNALEAFARDNYRQELDKRKNVAYLREQVSGFVEQFGAV